MSLLLPDSGLLFWMFVAFGIVFVILAKYGFPIIIRMVEDRKVYIDQSLEVAREANAQLSKLKQEGDALVAAANKEQGRILKEAMEERDKIVHEARKTSRNCRTKRTGCGETTNPDRERRSHPRHPSPGSRAFCGHRRESAPQES